MSDKLPSKNKDFNEWYNELVRLADLADYGPVRGTMIIKPYGYAIWERIQQLLDARIKAADAANAYFPLFIPESFITAEKKHIGGFAPEIAWVTHGGGKKLNEKLAVRPTSETVMYHAFAKWIQSWRDLPIKINQWSNIVRWELRTKLFLRTLEFLWQEGHTAHVTEKEAEKESERALKMYQDFAREILLIPALAGRKSEAEKFAGGNYTLALEALMGDGKGLQLATSHNLGQNFAKIFDVKFTDKKGKEHFVWQTSWGMTTRVIGALIMVHGDERGLVLPPVLAPIQVVVVPIYDSAKDRKALINYFERKIKPHLNGLRYLFDDRDNYSPGWKFNEWELKGVPVRIEIGKKEIKESSVTFLRRDDLKRRSTKDLTGIVLKKTLDEMSKNIFTKADKFLKDCTYKVNDYQEFKKIISENPGFIRTFWCGQARCEKKIKNETSATIRVILDSQGKKSGKCIACGKSSKTEVVFAKAY
jgi:prolyl-tRNA synthetase